MLSFFKKNAVKTIADILSNILDKMHKKYPIKGNELRDLMKAFDQLDKEKDIPSFFRDKYDCYNGVGKYTFENPRKDIITMKKKLFKNNETRTVDYKVIKEYYINYINCINEKKDIFIRKDCCKNLVAFILNIFLNYELYEISYMLCMFSYIHNIYNEHDEHNGIKFQDILINGVIRIYNGEDIELPINPNISIKKTSIQIKNTQKPNTRSKSKQIQQSKYIGMVDEKTYKTLKDKFIEKKAITKMMERDNLFSPKNFSKILPGVKEHLEKTYDESYKFPQLTVFDYVEMDLDKKTRKRLESEAKTLGIKENLFTKENIKNAVENMLSSSDKRTKLILNDFTKKNTRMSPVKIIKKSI